MRFKIILLILGFVFFAASTILSYYGMQPVHNLYYLFAWWSYIFFIDGLNGIISKNSIITDRTGHFLLMLPFSAGFWFIFELINVRLANWSYHSLPFDRTLRYWGYILSYATVLPAIFETRELILNSKVFSSIKIRGAEIREESLKTIFWSGIFILALILIFPGLFFALTWIVFLLIMEPINYKIGAVSLIRELRAGRWEKPIATAAAGLICGFLWEMWNYNSGAKWTYSVPFTSMFPKIFEMPLPGYLGFPFFALECYSFFNFISWSSTGEHWEGLTQKNSGINRALIYTLIIILIPLYILSMNMIDSHTVRYFIIM